MKGEVSVAPLLSVGMAWHSGRPARVDTHHGNSQPGAWLYSQVQSGLVIEDNSCVRPGREGFCLHPDANGLTFIPHKCSVLYSEENAAIAMGTVHLSVLV